MNNLLKLRTSLATRYDIDREIGAGGMATVYLARDQRHDRKVALKVLNPELGAVLGVERFLSEIKVTANLQHPNLLPLFDSGEADGLLFYVMPFVEGESLRARLDREKQLPIDEAIRIAMAVANALDYAHSHHVIHRDLKPENILLQHGQPVVADFGIALAVSKAGGNRVTQTGLSLGTPQYMSPEQATGDRVIDGRTDIYSLGALTYEMLTGEPPHIGHTSQAIIARLLTD
jgi:serine/threonine protein kinase